jgi:hypothetical protein
MVVPSGFWPVVHSGGMWQGAAPKQTRVLVNKHEHENQPLANAKSKARPMAHTPYTLPYTTGAVELRTGWGMFECLLTVGLASF